jgi:hypothetical protein
MAIPPEPIQELLARASLVVEAEVTRVLSTGKTPPALPAEPGTGDSHRPVASQTVLLKVSRVLHGSHPGAPDAALTVVKPEAKYALKAGNRGAFFLEKVGDELDIIGRYGPDTYKVASVEKALRDKG